MKYSAYLFHPESRGGSSKSKSCKTVFVSLDIQGTFPIKTLLQTHFILYYF